MKAIRRIPSWLRASAAVVGAIAMLSAPFVVMGYIAKHDTPEARERRIAAAYGRTRTSSAPSASAGYPASSSRDEAQPGIAEVQLGCWRLEGHLGGAPSLSALWFDECPDARRPTLSAGEYPFPVKPIYLSAWGEGLPLMRFARPSAELSEDLSDTEETAAGLIFLPASQQGSGYYVAAWTQATTSGSLRKGMRVGHYGASPTSVETSAGRVYMDPPPAVLEQLDDASNADEAEGR